MPNSGSERYFYSVETKPIIGELKQFDGGKAVDRSKIEDGTDHGSVSGWRGERPHAALQREPTCQQIPPASHLM